MRNFFSRIVNACTKTQVNIFDWKSHEICYYLQRIKHWKNQSFSDNKFLKFRNGKNLFLNAQKILICLISKQISNKIVTDWHKMFKNSITLYFEWKQIWKTKDNSQKWGNFGRSKKLVRNLHDMCFSLFSAFSVFYNILINSVRQIWYKLVFLSGCLCKRHNLSIILR